VPQWPWHMACPGKLGLLLFVAAGLLAAQKVVSARAGLITFVQGPVFVDGRRVALKATRFPQMKNGEALSTNRGRAELLLAPGVVLRLAENSQVLLEDTQLADTHVLLERGDALIEVLQLHEGNRIQVRLADTITEFTRPGLYRLGTMQKTLRVYGGEASVRSGPSGSGTMTQPVKRGMAVDLNPGLTASKFDRKETDALHAWAARRSFDLFMSDPEAREKQTHWQPSGAGYMENKNFGVEFRAFIRRRPGPPISAPNIPRAESR
jgi:hypothetical protein